MNGHPARRRTQAALAFASVYLIWGSTYLAIQIASRTIPPFLMSGIRMAIAGLLLYGWRRLRGAPRPSRLHWRSAAAVGAYLLLGGNGGVVWAVQRAPTGLTALMIATVPLWIAFLEWRGEPEKKIDAATIWALLAGFFGVLVLIGPGRFLGERSIAFVPAAVLVGASFLWAKGTLYSRTAELPSDLLLATAMEMIAGGLLLLAAGAALGELPRIHLEEMSTQSLAAFFYLIFFGSIVGFTSYIWLARTVSPARLATYAYVNPVIALFLGWRLAGERLAPRGLFAAAVILASVLIITLRHPLQKQEAAEPR